MGDLGAYGAKRAPDIIQICDVAMNLGAGFRTPLNS